MTVGRAALALIGAGLLWVGVLRPLAPHLLGGREGAIQVVSSTQTIQLVRADMDGADNARMAVIEYTDFECPFCDRFVRGTLPRVEVEFLRPGRLAHVVRNFPLEAIHPEAFQDARLFECAAAQGKRFEMHRVMFAEPPGRRWQGALRKGEGLGLKPEVLAECLKGATDGRIREHQAEGLRLGVRGTPTFVLGAVDGTLTFHPRLLLRGAVSIEAFRTAVERMTHDEALDR